MLGKPQFVHSHGRSDLARQENTTSDMLTQYYGTSYYIPRTVCLFWHPCNQYRLSGHSPHGYLGNLGPVFIAISPALMIIRRRPRIKGKVTFVDIVRV